MSILKLMCEECYEKEYGGLPNICGIPMYELSKKEMECHICGKKKHNVLDKERDKGTILVFK